MEKIIYHGSEKIIKIPQYGIGNRRNDYGQGFYCTEDIELAKEWACGNENKKYLKENFLIDTSEYDVIIGYQAYAGLSQRMLAEKSDVSIRQIQLFEQRERDINKTNAETLEKLSRALNCKMEDLLEK